MPSGGGSPMPGGGSQGGQSGGNSGGTGGQTAGTGGSTSNGSEGDPGFGDSAGGDLSLPSLVDEEPSYSSASASSGQQGGGAGGTGGSNGAQASAESGAQSSEDGVAQGSQSGDGTGAGSPGSGTVVASGDAGTGTRAQGGLEPDWGSDPMTTAERVAVLDRQLEESTGVFDAIIREEQRQQRSSRREQSSQAQSSGSSGTETVSSGRNPYEASDEEEGYGSVGGGIGGRSGGAPENPAIYEAPDDIPSGNDDDIVARQLREAAMREPDPEVRDALWNEYRKYKGIEIPEK